MKIIHIADLIDEKISGEWGVESANGSGTKVLRTTNFTNEGKLKMDSVVERQIEKNIVERKRLRYGDTIIEKSGGSPNQPVGRVVLFDLKAKEPYLCNNFTAILRPSKKVNSEYFFWALFHKHLTKSTLRFQNKTTGILNLKLERYLEEESIKLPDLSIQQKVVDVISQANAARQKRREANRLTEQFLQSAFLEMFGDPVRNEKGWKSKLIKDTCHTGSGGTPSRGRVEFFGGTIPWVKSGELNNQVVLDTEETLTELGFQNSSAKIVPAGSILVAMYGATVGKVALLKIEATTNQAVCYVTPGHDLINQYLLFCLRQYSNHLVSISVGGGQQNISQQVIRNLSIPLPPIALQQRFSALVEQVGLMQAKQRESERELEKLFQSLMQRYFGD